MRFTPLACVGCLGFASSLMALDYPGCEARIEVVRAMHDELRSPSFVRLKWTEQEAVSDRVLRRLITDYPREIDPQLEQIRHAHWANNQERRVELQHHYGEMAAAHPDDALALVLAANALFEADTPESIRLAEAARAKAPNFSYPALMLAEIYSEGLRADPAKFRENLRAYFSMCPASTEFMALRMLPKLADPELQQHIAAAVRKRLEHETDPLKVTQYEELWSLEFRSTPPAKHDALRKQVADDVKRLGALHAKPDANYLSVMMKGYKQSGLPAEVVTAFENRILREVPNSGLAFGIVYQRWKKENKEPESQTDRAAWKAYNAKLLERMNVWDRQYDTADLGSWRLDLMFADESPPEKEGVAAIEAELAHDREWKEPEASRQADYAEMLVDRKWRLDRAVALLDEARTISGDYWQISAGSDNLTPEQKIDRTAQVQYQQSDTAATTLRLALLLHKPEIAEAVRKQLEDPLPADSKRSIQSRYWHNRGLLAMVDQHQADALADFQTALQVRPKAPEMYRGKLDDPLKKEATELWKQMGGTEEAFARWSTPPAAGAAAEQQKQGRWEKAAKAMPAFELTDLMGKTWKLKSFEGKTVLINLWATWCGPCQAELPEFQKLYEKVKDRPDVQVISFNMDSELGLVAPFMKEKGYTFPAVIAYDFTRRLLDDIAIPQNWILDQRGKWLLTQMGFGGEPDWPGVMLQRLESTKIEGQPH